MGAGPASSVIRREPATFPLVRQSGVALALVGFVVGCPGSPVAPSSDPGDAAAEVGAATSAPPQGASGADSAGSAPRAAAPVGGSAVDQRATRLTPSVSGDPPRRTAERSAVEAGISQLSDLIRSGATDPANPWAMAHGLIAFGPDLSAADGRSAVDVIATYLEKTTVDGRVVWSFPTKTAINEPVEPHPFLITKAMVEAGVPLDRPLPAKDGRPTVRKLVDDLVWLFEVPRDELGWHNVAWALSVLAAKPPADRMIPTRAGRLSLEALASRALQRLEQEQGFLTKPMKRRRPDVVRKRRQGIYTHTCGGLHFVQAVARVGGHFPSLQGRVLQQLDAVRFRWAAERRIYRQLADMKPRYRGVLLVQELKFYGHQLETLALAAKWGLVKVDPDLRLEMRMVAADLLDTIRALVPLYGRLDRIREATPQIYYDLVGDGSHALRGLREGLVAFF